jgi:tetratricopeptide (TPR) repeat protein
MEACLKGDIDQGIAYYSKAIQLNPQDAVGYHSRGVAWGRKKEFDRAIADLTKAIQIDDWDSMVYFNRGTVRYEKGEYDAAIDDYNRYIKLRPDDAEGYYNRGCVWSKKRDFDRAIADYTHAIRLIRLKCNKSKTEITFSSSYYYNRGIAFYKKKEFNQAFADFTKVVEIRPEHADALSYLAWLLVISSKKDSRDGSKALELARRAVKQEPNYFSLSALAAAFAEVGKFDEAAITQEKAIALLVKEGNSEELVKYREYLNSYKAKKTWRGK